MPVGEEHGDNDPLRLKDDAEARKQIGIAMMEVLLKLDADIRQAIRAYPDVLGNEDERDDERGT